MRVYINGLRLTEVTSIDNLIGPYDVAGVEVYPGDPFIPIRFTGGFGDDGGAIAIWTK